MTTEQRQAHQMARVILRHYQRCHYWPRPVIDEDAAGVTTWAFVCDVCGLTCARVARARDGSYEIHPSDGDGP